MPVILEDVLLGYLEGNDRTEEPPWISERVTMLEDLLQLDRMPFPERDQIETAMTDLVAAGRLSGFALGIRFVMDVMTEIR